MCSSSCSAMWPRGMIATARLSRIRSIQPRAKQVSASAAPTAPARCGRRSLQSRQGRQKARRRGISARSMPRPSTRKVAPSAGDLAAIVAQHHRAPGHQRVGDRDAEPAGEMVVAGTRQAQRIVARRARSMAWRRLDRRHQADALQHARDQGRGDPVVAMPALADAAQQIGIGQPGEMAAGGLRRHAGDERQLLGRQRAAVHQRDQHVGARPVADQRRDLGNVRAIGHRRSVGGCRHPRQAPSVRPWP